MKTSGAAWQETHVSGVMDGGARGPLDRHRLRRRAECRAPASTLQTSRRSASSSPVPDPSRELLPGRAGPVRSGCCPRVSSLGASVASASGLGRWLCTLEFSAVLSEKKRKVAAPSPSFPLCPSFQKLLRATQQKGTGSVALPPSAPLLAHARQPPSARAWRPASAVARARGTERCVRAPRPAQGSGGRFGLPMDRVPPPTFPSSSRTSAFGQPRGPRGRGRGENGCRPFRAPAQSDRVLPSPVLLVVAS